MLIPLLEIEDVSRLLGIKPKGIHELVRRGLLGCVQVTPKVRKFTEEQVQEFISSRTVAAPKPMCEQIVNKPIDAAATRRLPSPKKSHKGGDCKKSSGDSDRAQIRKELRQWL